MPVQSPYDYSNPNPYTPRTVEDVNRRSRYEFYEYIKNLFKTMEIEYWGKTGLPEPPNRTFQERFEKGAKKFEKTVKFGTTFRKTVTTAVKVGKALQTGDAGNPKDPSLSKEAAKACVKMIIAGVKQVNKSFGSLVSAGSDIAGADILQDGKIEDAWVKPLETALENLFEEMFGSIPHGVNVVAANAERGFKLKGQVIAFGNGILNRRKVAKADVNSILHGGPELVANRVTDLLNRQIAMAAADIAMEGLKASLTIASFGAAHAAVELGSKATECLVKMGKMIHEAIVFIDFRFAAPVLASMELSEPGKVSERDEKKLRTCIAESPLCAALIMGHPYMSYYKFLVVTQGNEAPNELPDTHTGVGDPVHPSTHMMTPEQQKTLACFDALKKTARTYCKGVPHGLRSSDDVVQHYLEPLMRGSTTVTLRGQEDITALQSVMSIENDRRRFIIRIDRAIEQWKGVALADDATTKTASQGFGDVLFANPFKPENRVRKRDMIANVFKKAKHHFGHHPEKLFIQFISERCQRHRCGGGDLIELTRQLVRYLGAVDVAIPELRLERWGWRSGLFEDAGKSVYIDFKLGKRLSPQHVVPNYVDPNAKLLKLGKKSSLRHMLTVIVNEEKHKIPT